MRLIHLVLPALASAAIVLVSNIAPAAQAAGDAVRGKAAFDRIGCWSCHGYQGQGGSTGPKIGTTPLPYPAFSAFVRTTSGEMPPFTARILPEQDLRDIHAYLASIPPGPNAASISILQ